MLGRPSGITISAACAGVALGCALWLVLGKAMTEPRLPETGTPSASRGSPAQLGPDKVVANAIAHPLLARPKGYASPVVQLIGLSKGGGRAAALISINGKPAQWVQAGGAIEGVSVVGVRASGAMIETSEGSAELGLGQKFPAAAAPPAADADGETAPDDAAGP